MARSVSLLQQPLAEARRTAASGGRLPGAFAALVLLTTGLVLLAATGWAVHLLGAIMPAKEAVAATGSSLRSGSVGSGPLDIAVVAAAVLIAAGIFADLRRKHAAGRG